MALEAGVMTVCVEFAQNLKDCDWFGRQDPYCILTCGTQTFRTRTAKDAGRNPVWNETFRFNVINENEVVLLVKDEDVVRDDVIGTARVNLARARQQGSDKLAAPVASRKSGKQYGFVSVSLTYTPNSSLKPAQQQPQHPQHYAPPLQQAPLYYSQHYAAPPAFYALQPYPGYPYPQAVPSAPAPYYQQPAPYAYPPQPAPQMQQQPQGYFAHAHAAPSAPNAPSPAQGLGPAPPGYPTQRSATIGSC